MISPTQSPAMPPATGLSARLEPEITAALGRAAQHAGLLLTTDAVITEIKEKNKPAAPGMDEMDY